MVSVSDNQFKLTGFLKRPEVILFLTCCFLMQASHGTYYGFFSIALENTGYSKATIGFLWAEGVVGEILIMVFAGRLLAQLGTLPLVTLSLLLAALRWGICSITLSVVPLIIAQLLHAFSFGLFHVASVFQIHQMVPRPLRASGQSLYSSVSYGMGMGFGLVFNGFFFKTIGPSPLFAFSAVMALVGAGLILFLDQIQGQLVGERST
jgi:PPP family 3-phenylpropionic acid transporter